jgi:hypothetical protein
MQGIIEDTALSPDCLVTQPPPAAAFDFGFALALMWRERHRSRPLALSGENTIPRVVLLLT